MDPLLPGGRGQPSGTTIRSDPIPLVDLAFQHAEAAVEIVEAIVDVMARGKPAEAHAVDVFEAALAAFCGRRHCVGVADGTEPLALTLRAAGIGDGDEVIVPANGRLATATAVMQDERITLPTVMPGNEHIWHRYVVRVPNRDAVLAEMESAGIGAAVHYRVPIHLLRAVETLGYRRGDFPNAEAAADHTLSLPIYPGIQYQQVGRVADSLRRALRR